MSGFVPGDHFSEDRIDKLRSLEDMNVNPYPHEFNRSHRIGEFVQKFDEVDEITEDDSFQLAGRVARINDLGSIFFIDIKDQSGTVQLFIDDTGDERIDLLDLGDYIGASGMPMYTEQDELSLHVDSWEFLSKSLNHPPQDLNKQSIYSDMRAVAMRFDEIRKPLEKRFQIERVFRDYLNDRGFLEVSTPILQNIYGGARATPFKTKLEAKDQEMYLRISPELYLKRMIMGDFEKIYEISKVFRNEDIDATHNPEFTLFELYEAYADYNDMMDLTENLIIAVLDELNDGEYTVEYEVPVQKGDETDMDEVETMEIDFTPPWERIPMEKAIQQFSEEGHNVSAKTDEEIEHLAVEHGATFEGGFSRGLGIEYLFEELVEEKLIDPVFIIDHPIETTSLCKNHREKEGKVERFELFLGGDELANAYTELNHPIQQGKRFAEQAERFEAGDEEAHRMDEDYVESLSHGMPPTGGLGIGIGRLARILTNRYPIKDVITFPLVSTNGGLTTE